MAINKSLNEMEKLYQLLIEKKIKLSLGVYPWPHQLIYDSSNSLQVKIWQKFVLIDVFHSSILLILSLR